MSEKSYLEMSDEELLAAPEPVVASDSVADTNDEATPTTDSNQETKQEDTSEDSLDSKDTDKPGTPATADAPLNTDKPEGKPQESDEKKVESSIDYEAEYKRLLAPFKANGRDVTVGSVDDAITLMQMGANYNKKMAGLKPNLKVLKLLENNGLLNEEKLSYLIDLDRKNPQAIGKLLKDSGLDPLELDPEKASEYQPQIHTVDDREIELDTVLDEIQHTPTYTRTLGIVSKEWDGASKQMIAQHPQLLAVINDHVQRGIYDVISATVEREKMLGRLNGLSDIEAYRQVGDAIQAQGGFDNLGRPQSQTPTASSEQGKPTAPANSAKLNDQRRAASPSKAGSPTTSSQEFNPLAMSDAEFAKYAEQHFR